MTSEQIKIVNNIKFSIINAIDNIDSEQMWKMLEQAYEQKEQESCEDCISRAEALKAIEEEKQDWGNTGVEAIDGCLEVVGNLPSVTPSIPDVENDFNLGYNCGYADAMIDIAESEE